MEPFIAEELVRWALSRVSRGSRLLTRSARMFLRRSSASSCVDRALDSSSDVCSRPGEASTSLVMPSLSSLPVAMASRVFWRL